MAQLTPLQGQPPSPQEIEAAAFEMAVNRKPVPCGREAMVVQAAIGGIAIGGYAVGQVSSMNIATQAVFLSK